MKKNKKQPLEVPPIEVLEKELHRELTKRATGARFEARFIHLLQLQQ